MKDQIRSRKRRGPWRNGALAWVSVLVLLAMGATMAYAQDAAMPSIEDVWFYAPMDGTLQPMIDEPFYETRHRHWTAEAITDDPAPAPKFVDGLVREGVYIGGPTDGRSRGAVQGPAVHDP